LGRSVAATDPAEREAGCHSVALAEKIVDGDSRLTDSQVGAMRGLATYLVHRADPEDLAAAFDLTILDAAAWQHSMEVLAGWSVADRLAQIEAPALVLVGPRRPVLATAGAPDCAPLAARRGRRLRAQRPCLFFDEPGRFLAVVGEWLARHDLLPVPTSTAR